MDVFDEPIQDIELPKYYMVNDKVFTCCIMSLLGALYLAAVVLLVHNSWYYGYKQHRFKVQKLIFVFYSFCFLRLINTMIIIGIDLDQAFRWQNSYLYNW